MAIQIPMAVYLALMAAGTYTTYKANEKARKRSNAATLDAQRRQTDLNEEAQAKTLEFAGDVYEPETRAENETQAADDATASIMQQLTASRDRGMGTTSKSSGRITGDYSTGRAKMVAKTMQRASLLASLMGKARGATDLRFREGIKTAGLGGEMADLESLMRSRSSSDRGLIGIAGQPNNAQLALGGLMSGIGTSGALGSLTTTSAPQATVGTASAPAYNAGVANQANLYRMPYGTTNLPLR